MLANWPGVNKATTDVERVVIDHLKDFVSLTSKGFLLVASIVVAAEVGTEKIKVFGADVPRDRAALLVSVFFLAIFVAIALHGLNVLMASRHLSSNKVDQWSLGVFTGAGVLSPLCCWPGRLGSILGGLSYGIPFLLWWGMDISNARLHATQEEGMYPLRLLFIGAGVTVGLVMGCTYVRLYRRLDKRPALQEHVRFTGILKWAAAVVFTWLGYAAWVLTSPDRFSSWVQLTDVALAYPLTYALPAWGLMKPRILVAVAAVVFLFGLFAFSFGEVFSAWSAVAIGSLGLITGLYRAFVATSEPRA